MIGIQQARPPFVQFKQVVKDDPKRSLELGYRVTKDVDFAFIMQPGSKDCLEIEAKAWLEAIKRKNLERSHDAFPDEWVSGFFAKFEAWKAGQEEPLDGTSVKEWPVLSPSQVQNFIAIGIRTIEDVAAMTEEAMARVGMGGRSLRDKARDWISTKELAGNALLENETLKQQIESLQQQINDMKADKPKRGRPKLAEAA